MGLKFVQDIDKFKARRAEILEKADQDLEPIVNAALKAYADGDNEWYEEIVTGASVIWLETFEEDHPDDTVLKDWQLSQFQIDLRESLKHTKTPSDEDTSQVDRVTSWLGTYTVNRATDSAMTIARLEDPGAPIYQMWISMRDDNVRESHAEADGQIVRSEEKFNIGGNKLSFPGEPVGEPGIWINCRCVTRPMSEEMVMGKAKPRQENDKFAAIKKWPGFKAKENKIGDVVDGKEVVYKWSVGDEVQAVIHGRIREVTVTEMPAITGTGLRLDPVKESAAVAASAGMRRRAEEYFRNPNFGIDSDSDTRLVFQKRLRPEESDGYGCPITVEEDGYIYGHFALHGRCHSGFTDVCVYPPSSENDFSRFLTGEAIKGIPTGVITMDTDHGVTSDGRVKSYRHLADTGLAVADVTVGRDMHGFWCAGRIRAGISKEKIQALKGSTLSGEWLPYGNRLLLSGILAVNSGAFFVARKAALAASGGIRQYTVGPVCPSCGSSNDVDKRISTLENALATVLGKVR